MKYAIIKNGGKQYRVSENEVIELDKLNAALGEAVTFDQVLMLVNGDEIKLGKPLLSSIQVKGEVVKQARQDKINVIKFRRRKHHMKKIGHRQYYTAVKITAIEG